MEMQERYARIKAALLQEKGTDPIAILKEVASKDFVSLHGPEHHFLDGGAFLTALHNAGMAFDLSAALDALRDRGLM